MEFENNNNEENFSASPNGEGEEGFEDEDIPSQESLLKSELLKHPIFLFADDELLSTLIKPLSLIIRVLGAQFFPLEMNIFKQKMYNLIFGNKKISELSEFQGFNLSNKTTCGKHITMNEVYFRCIDCDIMTHPDFHALLCANCFEKSNHKNHRILRVQKQSPGAATCDCGDDEAFNPQGFCPDHQPKAINIEELLEKFPNEILKNYQAVLKKGLYGVVSTFEIAERCEGTAKSRLIKSLAEKAMEKLLDFWSLCYTEINESFLPILSITLKDQFEEPFNKVWHDCEDMKAETELQFIDIKQERTCRCTILGNLFRLGIKMGQESQSKLEKMLVECVKDSDFREYVAIEFTRYNHFFYNYKTENDSHEVNNQSRLLRMQMQLYQKEESLVKIMELGHFSNFVSVIKRALPSAQTVNYDLYHIIADIRSAIIYFLVPTYKTAELVIKSSDLIKEYLDIFMNFEMLFFYEGKVYVGLFEHLVNYRSINRGLMVEKVLCQPIESCINLIRNFSQEEKAKLYGEIVKQWYGNFEAAKSVHDSEIKNGTVSFHPCLERVFCCLVRNYLGEAVTVGGLESFFKQNMPEQNMNEVAEKVIEGVLRTLGMIRYIHLIHNFRYGQIWHVYYYFYNAFFEVDIALIQMMMSLTKPEGLFETLVKNFFVYAPDLVKLFTEEMKLPVNQDYLKQQLTVAEDFLNLLIYLTNDEICLLNLDTRYMKYSYNDIKSDSRYLRVTEKATKNVLLGSYWTTLVNVKSELENVFLQQQNVDEVIQKLTILSEKDHKIRIKDEYQEDFDPYIFYRFPSFQQNVTNSMTTKAQQDKKIDLVSGQYYKDLPQYLKNNQMILFQSNLPNFLSLFVRKFNNILAPLLRPALKLILLNLQVLDELFKTGKEEEEKTMILRKKMEENYLVNEFTNGLNEIMMKDIYKDCEHCIQKIQGLLKRLSEKLEKKDVIEDEEMLKKGKNVEEKKRLAKERMAKLKENFAKKQEIFAEKNSALLAQSKASEETKDTEESFAVADGINTCQYCIGPILENEEEYVTPIYINFTNNFYDTEAENVFRKQEDYSDMSKANWWPVVTNCNHQYHKKCYEEVFKSSAMKIGTFVTNKYEAYCPLCKTLTNSFLGLNKKKIDDVEQPSTHIKLHFPELYKSFTEKIVGLVAELQKKLAVNNPLQVEEEEKEKNAERITRISFERAYEYFIEGFYLQNKAKDLKKQFVLYKDFFKGFKDFFVEKENALEILPRGQIQPSLFKEISKINNDINKLLSYQPEPVVNQLFISILREILSNNTQDEEHLWRSQLAILQEYIVFKITQAIALLKLDKSMSLEDCLSFYQTNLEFQAKMSSQLIFPMQKIILASWLNFSVGFDDLPRTSNEFYQVLLEEERLSGDGDYLSQLLSQVGISASFEQFVQESFKTILSLSSQEDLNPLNSLLTAKTPELEFEAPRIVKYGPRSIKLPENYAQFNDKYFTEKCQLCEKFSHHLLTSVCLICGEIMCEMYCDPLTKVSGNLNRHAKKYHMGMGVFIDMVKLGGRLVNIPLNLRYKEQEPYIDNFGQSFNSVLDSHQKLKEFDFAKFVLNPKYVEEIDQMIRLQSIRQTIFKIGLKLNQKSQNGYL